MAVEIKTVKLTDIKANADNPRVIKDDDFKALVKSLKELPEMTEAREIVVNTDMVILGGNMRYRAMQQAGWNECVVKIVDWPIEKQREFIIKDNVSRGEWDYDLLANDWDTDELEHWGLDTPEAWQDDTDSISSDNDGNNEGELTAVAVVVAYDDIEALDRLTAIYELDRIDLTPRVREELTNQQKAYVFRKQ